MPSLLTSSALTRAHKNVQMYLILRGNTALTFGESHGSVLRWLPKTPRVFLRSSGLLEREQ